MSKSQSRIFSRLQYFPYIVYVRKVKITIGDWLKLCGDIGKIQNGIIWNFLAPKSDDQY